MYIVQYVICIPSSDSKSSPATPSLNYERKLWVDQEKKANGAKSILSCKTLEVIITFAGRTGNLGNLGRGLGSLE